MRPPDGGGGGERPPPRGAIRYRPHTRRRYALRGPEAELVGLAERAAAAGRWTILTFHGINEGHLAVADVDLRELVDHLRRHRERIWTAPVATVAQQIIDWRREIGRLEPDDRRG